MPISVMAVLVTWSLSLAAAGDLGHAAEPGLHRAVRNELPDRPADLIASSRNRPADIWCETDADLEEEETGEESADALLATGAAWTFDASNQGRRRPILQDRSVPKSCPRSPILRC